MRWRRDLLRHRAFRMKISTALKNRSWSEFRERDIVLRADLGTLKGRRMANSAGVYEVSQDMEILEVVASQMKQIELGPMKRYADVKPVKWMQSVPGIGFLTALMLYAEICDIRRFSNPDKLAHYAGLVPRVKQTAEHTRMGRETRANMWLKCALIEAAWSHINWCPDGRLAKVFENACRRKKDKKKAIKIVARKLVNIIWAVWTYEKEFTMDKV
jgi:transposase